MVLNLVKNVNKEYISTANCTKSTAKENKYIVIHYVGAEGDAISNAKYFQKEPRGASANYFVGFNGDIYQSVDDGNIAWHVGAQKYIHKQCRNTNSIGIELCCHKNPDGKTWRFEKQTVNRAAALTVALMFQYDIPLKNVIRHYDVTGKICPEPFVRDKKAWADFKALVKQMYKAEKGKYVVVHNCYVRNDNLQIIKDKDNLPGYLRPLCKNKLSGATIEEGSVVKIVSIKQDSSGNIWGVTPTNQYLPVMNKGVVKLQKKY